MCFEYVHCACMQIHLNQYRLRWKITIQCSFHVAIRFSFSTLFLPNTQSHAHFQSQFTVHFHSFFSQFKSTSRWTTRDKKKPTNQPVHIEKNSYEMNEYSPLLLWHLCKWEIHHIQKKKHVDRTLLCACVSLVCVCVEKLHSDLIKLKLKWFL